MPRKNKFDELLKLLNIDETKTSPVKREKQYTKVNLQIPLVENYNQMADLLFLPTTKQGYKYLLVICDLASKKFDIEPIKNKTSKSVLEAMKTIYKRNYVKIPFSSIQTDSGNEFKHDVDNFLESRDITHKITLPHRHSQNSMIESLNKQLGRLLNGYMNYKEIETNKRYNEWTDILQIVRTELNKIRAVKLPKDKHENMMDIPTPQQIKQDSKFSIGDVVYRKLDYPQDALGHDQPTANFRVGDFRFEKTPRKITRVIIMNKNVPYRYMVEGIKNASFTDAQLMESKEEDTKYTIKKILGKKTQNKKDYYLVWWNGYKKDQSTWEPKSELLKDITMEDIKRLSA
jgi:hypothetical protein